MVKVLFVCLGNICRSPMAEAVFASQVVQAGLQHLIFTDSAGTANYHPGERPDHRTLKVLKLQGIQTPHLARQIQPADFTESDYIIAMDRQNLMDLERVAERHPGPTARLELMGAYCPEVPERGVPDPYYDDLAAFELVYNMLKPACQALLEHIRQDVLSAAAQS